MRATSGSVELRHLSGHEKGRTQEWDKKWSTCDRTEDRKASRYKEPRKRTTNKTIQISGTIPYQTNCPVRSGDGAPRE